MVDDNGYDDHNDDDIPCMTGPNFDDLVAGDEGHDDHNNDDIPRMTGSIVMMTMMMIMMMMMTMTASIPLISCL